MSSTDHARHSKGGLSGHLVRRLVHVGMLVLPWLWYWHLEPFETATGWSRTTLALVVVGVVAVAEAGRLALGLTIFGQRAYEAHQVSALAWGSLGVGLVLAFAPQRGVQGAGLGLPIVAALALVDPLMGELRRAGQRATVVVVCGLLGCAAVWLAATAWLDTPWMFAPIMAPLTVAAEWPRLRWVDDNATMTLGPLAAVLILDPFLSW